mmetsp:Transcript_32043/g.69826  ORF Transcript_32043/g.69826 Transcript_32043/m.69826 type:complete len:234 (+) Transcript_32043:278-979(+)
MVIILTAIVVVASVAYDVVLVTLAAERTFHVHVVSLEPALETVGVERVFALHGDHLALLSLVLLADAAVVPGVEQVLLGHLASGVLFDPEHHVVLDCAFVDHALEFAGEQHADQQQDDAEQQHVETLHVHLEVEELSHVGQQVVVAVLQLLVVFHLLLEHKPEPEQHRRTDHLHQKQNRLHLLQRGLLLQRVVVAHDQDDETQHPVDSGHHDLEFGRPVEVVLQSQQQIFTHL